MISGLFPEFAGHFYGAAGTIPSFASLGATGPSSEGFIMRIPKSRNLRHRAH